MATIQIPWTTGNGNITLTYTGQGNGTITVSSSDNKSSVERSQTLTISGGGITRQITVRQDAKPLEFQYLTFVAKTSGTFKLSRNAVDYSLDDGSTWTTLAANTDSPTVAAGSRIMWKGTLTPVTTYGIGTFSSSGSFDIEGNIMSLLFGDNFINSYGYPEVSLAGKDYAFAQLFRETSVINAGGLYLPAATLSNWCYFAMFMSCESLEVAPHQLPAITCTESCYRTMFSGCTSLTAIPLINAQVMAEYCFCYMFNSCTSLLDASGFGINSALAKGCCSYMFYNCSELRYSPSLGSSTLVAECYDHMFYNCRKLSYVVALFTTTPGTDYTNYWLYGVSLNGTFIRSNSATWNVRGPNGIPTGWTVRTR